MSVVLFNSKVLNEARTNLRAGSHVHDAAADIGGYQFECGTRDFADWARAVCAELSLELSGTKFAAMEFDPPDVYARMIDRAHELARELVKTQSVPLNEIWDSLNAFLKNPPPPRLPKPPTRAMDVLSNLDRTSEANEPIKKAAVGGFQELLRLDPKNIKEIRVLPAPRVREQSVRNPTAHNTPRTNVGGSALQRLLTELRSHIGLAAVKKDVEELGNSIQIDRARRAQGLRVADRSLHMVFYGNPGTGKTTVARLVAQIYTELGVLDKGHLVCTDRAGLIANYVGQTATKVTAVVQEALGGVLFIDEAYSLAPPDSRNDFGQEAIQQLLLLMENHRNELVVIVAGYPDEMTRFLDANPGLRSRFTKKLLFEDYTPEEMVRIFVKFCSEEEYNFDVGAEAKLLNLFRVAYSRRDKTFGNARFVRNCFQKATANLANRLVKTGAKDRTALMTITEADIPAALEEPGEQKRFSPDLGTWLAAQGQSQKTMCIYPSIEITHIAVVGLGQFCITQNGVLADGREYCGTFDFGEDILQQIVARMPDEDREALEADLEEDPDGVRTIPLPQPINIGIAARLGKPQIGLHEKFIPLVIMEVFG